VHVVLFRDEGSYDAAGVDPASVLVDRGCTVTEIDLHRAPDPARTGGVDRVIVAAGDAAIASAARQARRWNVPLGIVPLGAEHTLARELQLPTDIERACVLAASGDELQDLAIGELAGIPFVHGATFERRTLRGMSVISTIDGEPAYSGRASRIACLVDRMGHELRLLVDHGRGGGERVALRGTRVELLLRHRPRLVVDGAPVACAQQHLVAGMLPGGVRVVVG
jgi:hypothetical protein